MESTGIKARLTWSDVKKIEMGSKRRSGANKPKSSVGQGGKKQHGRRATTITVGAKRKG